MSGGPTRHTEPVDRTSRLCAAMTAALEAHPEYQQDRAVVFLTDGTRDRCVAHLSGYDDDKDAMIDVFVHMQAVLRANGLNIDFIGIPEDVGALTTPVEVRCRVCGERATVDAVDENRWYETHRCG